MSFLPKLLGAVSTVTALGSMQFKSIKLVLLLQIICNASGAACYILLGSLSACGLYFVATAQSLIFLGYRLVNKEAPKYFTGVFVAMFLLCSVLTFKTTADVISMLAAVTCALALAQKNSTLYRIIILINGALWIAYDIVSTAYEMLPAHIVTAFAAVIGIVRLDLGLGKKKKDV